MPETRLVFLLMFCIFTAIIFLWTVICEKSDSKTAPKCIIIPIAADTENIELIARDIVLKAVEYYGNIKIVLLNMGASEEQLIIFDKALDGRAEYKVADGSSFIF